MLESEMLSKGLSFLENNKQYKIVKQEVPFLSRCIDVILINEYDEIISIEFKVSKWRHAIEQAKNHKLGADKAYICLPERNISEVLKKAVADAGIGLFLFDSSKDDVIYEAIPAPSQKENIPVFINLPVGTCTEHQAENTSEKAQEE